MKLFCINFRHKKITDNNEKSGRGTSTWQYFDAIHGYLLAGVPAIKPIKNVASCSTPAAEATSTGLFLIVLFAHQQWDHVIFMLTYRYSIWKFVKIVDEYAYQSQTWKKYDYMEILLHVPKHMPDNVEQMEVGYFKEYKWSYNLHFIFILSKVFFFQNKSQDFLECMAMNTRLKGTP